MALTLKCTAFYCNAGKRFINKKKWKQSNSALAIFINDFLSSDKSNQY